MAADSGFDDRGVESGEDYEGGDDGLGALDTRKRLPSGPSPREWSAPQRVVFEDAARGSGHTVVRARAGSGKTTTIVEALRHMPKWCKALFVAFNKDIAKELGRRVPSGVEAKTTHSYGRRQCAWHYGRDTRIDKNRTSNFARVIVGGSSDVADVRKALDKAVSLCKGALAKTVDDVDAVCDAFGIDVAEEWGISREQFIDDVLRILAWSRDPFTQGAMKSAREPNVWVIVKHKTATIDFDDMVWLPVINKLRVWQFDRVVVDETQDLNAAQIALVLAACKPGGRILAVGDDRQGIYCFRGADSKALDNVIAGLKAKVLPLSITYRCARSIVAVANTVVPDLEAAPGAIDGVVREAREADLLRDAGPGDFVLSRTNAPLVPVCLALLSAGKRAMIQGKDIGAQLAIFVKKSKCKTIEALRDYVEAWRDREVARMLEKDESADTTLIEDKAATILALAEHCDSVEALLAEFESLFSNADPASKVVLSTTHKAKGLERDRVWALADTYMRQGRKGQPPSKEEENLWYVAVTRAKRELVLVRGLT
jgi:DNA helicase-2/ATP-dependent DNA helicase PcrA